MVKTLREILPHALLSASSLNRSDPIMSFKIKSLSLDSRSLDQGSLFFALPSVSVKAQVDGRSYIEDAFKNGASVVLAESNACASGKSVEGWQEEIHEKNWGKVIWIADLRRWMSIIGQRYYDSPSQQLRLLGVTGTNGKTSCTYFLAQMLDDFGCGLMGTLGMGHLKDLQPTLNTTADVLKIQRCLREMVEGGASYAAMEVSSHALDQGRVDGLGFDTALYTNLTGDHLDYHGSFEAYGAAKEKLFEMASLNQAVFNVGDEHVSKVCRRIVTERPSLDVWGYSSRSDLSKSDLSKSMKPPVDYLPKSRQVWLCAPIAYRARTMCLDVSIGGEPVQLEVPLVGAFNAENILAVVTVLKALGIEPDVWLKKLPRLQPPPGRMQLCLLTEDCPAVVVDFAHTPAALESALIALKPLCKGSLWCVFGCGGDRDKSKRPLMGEISMAHADRVVLTADNSRTEITIDIIEDILRGLATSAREAVLVIEDRKEAIHRALEQATAEDWVLIAGKGHENTQDLSGIKLPFSDVEVVSQYFSVRNQKAGSSSLKGSLQ